MWYGRNFYIYKIFTWSVYVCIIYLLCVYVLTCTDVQYMICTYFSWILFRNIYIYSYTDIFTYVLYGTNILSFMTLGFLIATTPVSGMCHRSLTVRPGHGHPPNSRDCCNSTSILYTQSKDSDSVTEVWRYDLFFMAPRHQNDIKLEICWYKVVFCSFLGGVYYLLRTLVS